MDFYFVVIEEVMGFISNSNFSGQWNNKGPSVAGN